LLKISIYALLFRIIEIAGDSCGAGLAVSLISEIMNEFLPLPRAAILVSPWLSMELTSPTYQTNAHYDYLTLQSTRAYRDLYLPPDISYTDPGISPIHLPSFQYFPPMLVIYGAKEVFQHEIEVLIKKCKDDGVDIQNMAAPNAAHVWIMLEHLCRNDAAWTNAIKNTAEWCARQISSDL
jgi:acetyl esterase/lipase